VGDAVVTAPDCYLSKLNRLVLNTDDDALAQHWLKKYKSVSYDIEDAIDELEANATIWKNSPSKVRLYDRVLTRVYKHGLS
jgi:aquaporin TIP